MFGHAIIRRPVRFPPAAGLRNPSRRVRLIAATAVRDEIQHLPHLLANVAPQVDGIVAVDDGSSDGSTEFLEAAPEISELVRVPADRPRWDEVANTRELLAAARRQHADWILMIDADERLERDFRARAERVIARGRLFGLNAYNVRICELWDSRDQFRWDGRWRQKLVARLFKSLPDHRLHTWELHGVKAPLQARRIGEHFPVADLRVYHLSMIRPEDRAAKRARYERLDPENRWQAIGYSYLTDERGLETRPVGRRRAFVD